MLIKIEGDARFILLRAREHLLEGLRRHKQGDDDGLKMVHQAEGMAMASTQVTGSPYDNTSEPVCVLWEIALDKDTAKRLNEQA